MVRRCCVAGIAVLFLELGPISALQAQGGTLAGLQQDADLNSTLICGSQFPLVAVSNVSCQTNGFTYAGSASAIDGVLRASVSLAATTQAGPYGFLRGTGFVSAQWQDRLTLTSLTPGVQASFVTFSLRFHGSVDLAGPRSRDGYLVALGSGNFQSAGGGGPAPLYGHVIDDNAGPTTIHADYDVDASYRVPYTDLMLFTYALSLSDFHTSWGGRGSYTGSISSDFSSTVGLTSITAEDAAGNDITSEVSATFQNGTIVGYVIATPEPSALSLLASGLVALGIACSRRRRPAGWA